MYRNRTRRHHRTAQLAARKAPHLVTATGLLDMLGFDADFTRRYAGQVTRTAKKAGTVPAATTYTTRNGRARRTAAYDLRTQAVALLVAVATYKRTAAHFGLAA